MSKIKLPKPELLTNYTPVFKPKPALEIATIDDAPTVCVEMSAELIPYLLGLLEIYRWPDRIRGTEEEKKHTVGLFQDLMARLATAGECSMFKLQQGIANPCHLYQSTDGGATWELAFDYSRCKSGGDVLLAMKLIDNHYAGYEQTLQQYLNSETYIPPDVADAAQADLDAALCYTCNMLVDMLCEAVRDKRETETTGINLMATVIATIAAAAVTLITGGNVPVGVAVGLAIGEFLTSAAAAAWNEINDNLLENDAAKQAVACCMYDALKGSSLTRAALETSLDNCGFNDPISNEAQLRGAVASSLQDDKIQMAFFETLQLAVRQSEIGVLPGECACNDILVTFDAENWQDWQYVATPWGALASTDSGIGNPAPAASAGVAYIPAGQADYYGAIVEIDLLSDQTVFGIQADFRFAATDDVLTHGITFLDAARAEINSHAWTPNGLPNNTWFTASWTGSIANVRYVRITCSRSKPDASGAWIDNIRVTI